MIGSAGEVIVFGTGALATRVGWHLAHSGAAVTLVGTWTAALEAVGARGIGLEIDGVLEHVPARAARLGQTVGPAPLVLVLVKSHRTPDVAAHALAAVAPDGLVLSLQNGLGNVEVLEAARVAASAREASARAATGCGGTPVGDAGVGAITSGDSGGSAAVDSATVTIGVGVTALGSTMVGAGWARAGGAGETVLGAPADMPPLARAILDAFATRLRAEGLDVRTEPDVGALVWRKLAVNCAINPLSAILGVPNGRLLDRPAVRARLRAAAGEVATVAAAIGIDAGAPGSLADLAEAVARSTAGNRSSMLQDIDRGAPTEVDALCGAVVGIARRAGLAAPVNAELWREVRALEDRGRQVAEACA